MTLASRSLTRWASIQLVTFSNCSAISTRFISLTGLVVENGMCSASCCTCSPFKARSSGGMRDGPRLPGGRSNGEVLLALLSTICQTDGPLPDKLVDEVLWTGLFPQ